MAVFATITAGPVPLTAVPALIGEQCLLLMLLSPIWLISPWLPRTSLALAAAVAGAWITHLNAQLNFAVVTGAFAPLELIVYALINPVDSLAVSYTSVQAESMLLLALGLLLVIAFAYITGPGRWRVGRLSFVVPIAVIAAPLPLALFVTDSMRGPLFRSLMRVLGPSDLPTVMFEHRQYRAPSVTRAGRREDLPDVVIWIAESTRADMLSVGHGHFTPFLSSLAKDSLWATNAYTTTTHTSKSIVGILCGHYPAPQMEILEAQDGQFRLRCLPHILREAGYESSVFVQTATGTFEDRVKLTENLGFDRTVVREDLDTGFKQAGYFAMDEYAAAQPIINALTRTEGAAAPRLLVFLSSQTHHPYAPPGMVEPLGPPFLEYTRSISYLDGFFASLWKRLGVVIDWDRTILVVVGDHGEAFGEHGLLQHDQVPYEEAIRIPLLIRFPPRVSARPDAGLRQTLDIVPTILDLTGIEWEGVIAGTSMMRSSGHRAVVTTCWYTDTCHAYIRSDGLKAIFYFGPTEDVVYDVNADPAEQIPWGNDSSTRAVLDDAREGIASARAFAASAYR